MRLVIVVNRQAKRTRDPALLDQLSQQLESARAAGFDTALVATQTPAELEPALRAQAAAGCDVLAVCGGDGTLAALLSTAATIWTQLPPLLLVPGGTMNTVARNLGLRGEPLAQLSSGLKSLAETADVRRLPTARLDVMRVDITDERPLAGRDPDLSQPATARTRYGFIFGAAMGARYLSAYDSHPQRGPLWATWLALRTVGSSLIPGGGGFARWLFALTPTALSIDGQAQPESAFRTILCATVPDVGLGFRVPWQAGAVPGRFHVVASGIGITRNALQLPRMLRGQPLSGTPHVDRLAQTATLRFDSPQQLTLDGEVFAGSQITLSLGSPLHILLPP